MPTEDVQGRIRFRCAGKDRATWLVWWLQLEGPRPPEGFDCDGCSWSPDWLKATGYILWPACVIHDYHYREAHAAPQPRATLVSAWPDRARADAILYRNLLTMLRVQGANRAFAEAVAWAYWGRVRVWGAGSYKGPWQERSWLGRVWEAWVGGRPRE